MDRIAWDVAAEYRPRPFARQRNSNVAGASLVHTSRAPGPDAVLRPGAPRGPTRTPRFPPSVVRARKAASLNVSPNHEDRPRLRSAATFRRPITRSDTLVLRLRRAGWASMSGPSAPRKTRSLRAVRNERSRSEGRRSVRPSPRLRSRRGSRHGERLARLEERLEPRDDVHDTARELGLGLGALDERARDGELRAAVLGGLDGPGHAHRALGLDVGRPARVEGHRHGLPGLDVEHLAVRRDAPVLVGVGQRRALRPVRRDARPVVVADGVVAIGDRVPDAFGRRLDVDVVDVVDRSHRCLQLCLDGPHGADDRLGELAGPSVVDEADRHRVQEVALLATDALGRHESGLLQDAQMLHDPEARHRGQVHAQLTERLAIALEELVEQDPPTGVGERPEDRSHVIRHAADFM